MPRSYNRQATCRFLLPSDFHRVGRSNYPFTFSNPQHPRPLRLRSLSSIVSRSLIDLMKSGFPGLVAAASCWFLASLLGLAQHLEWVRVSGPVFVVLRWLGIAFLANYSFRRKSLTTWIFLGMIAGAEFGYDWPATATSLQVLGTIFLRLIKVIIAPLLFGTLVVGIAGHADLKRVGRMGIKALIYFEVVSTLALLIGFAASNISRAGEGVALTPGSMNESLKTTPHSATELITNIFPENIAKSVAEGQVLQVVVFSVLFGMALALVPEAKRRPLVAFAESLSETMFKFTNLVMFLAPVGVFGAIGAGEQGKPAEHAEHRQISQS